MISLPVVTRHRASAWRNLLGPLLWVAMIVATTSRAEAADKLVTVYDPKVEGTLTAEERSRFDTAVADALRELQYQIVPVAERDTMINGEGVQNCFTEECQDKIGRLLGSQAVLVYKLKITRPDKVVAAPPVTNRRPRAGSRDAAKDNEPEPAGASNISWSMTANLFNVEVGSLGATAKGECSKCSATLAAQNLGELVKKIVLEDAARPRGTVEILSEPANASVIIDGRDVGVTPYKHGAFAGRHEVTVRKVGHKSKQEAVNVIEGQKTSATLRLSIGQDDRFMIVTERQPRPKWRVGLGVAALAGGVVMLGFGGRALDLDGRCTETPGAPQLKCTDVFNTQNLGVGLVAGGAAISILGMVAISLPGRAVEVQKPMPSDPTPQEKSPAPPAAPAKKAHLNRFSFGLLGSGAGMRAEGSF